MKIIKAKIKMGQGKEGIYYDLPKEEKGNTGAVVDLMPLRRKSLEMKKKTASSKKISKKTTAHKTRKTG